MVSTCASAETASQAAADPVAQAANQPNGTAAPTAAPAPVLPQDPPAQGEMPFDLDQEPRNAASYMIRSLLVLLGVILLAYFALHKGVGLLGGRLAQGRMLRIVDRIGLEPKKTLYIVEVARHYYLIGTSEGGVSCLATLETPAEGERHFDHLVQGGGDGATARQPGAGSTTGGEHG